MNQSARKEYFEQNPALDAIYETVDGLLFKTESEANSWNGTKVTTLNREDYINEADEPVLHVVTAADLNNASSVAETFGAKEGDTISLQP